MSAPTERPAPDPAPDPAALRRLFGHVPAGLVTVAALGEDGPLGLLVASFTPVSLTPPLVSVNIGRSSSTFPALRDHPCWGISVLSEHQHDVADRFRLPAERRFGELDWTATDDGAVHLDGAAATLTARPTEFIAAGDHVIALLELTGFSTDHRAPAPLIFHHSRFHRLDKEPLR